MKRFKMTDDQNNNETIDAIMEYPLLAEKVKQVLKTLVLFDSPVSAESVINASGLGKQVVYPALNKLIQSDFVDRLSDSKTSCYLFSVKDNNIQNIIDLYHKTKIIKGINLTN